MDPVKAIVTPLRIVKWISTKNDNIHWYFYRIYCDFAKRFGNIVPQEMVLLISHENHKDFKKNFNHLKESFIGTIIDVNVLFYGLWRVLFLLLREGFPQ